MPSLTRCYLEVPRSDATWQAVVLALARENRKIYLQGLTPGAGAYVLFRFFQKLHRPFLVVTPNTAAYEIFCKDLGFFLPEREMTEPDPWSRLLFFPAHEVLPFKELSFDTEVCCARVGAAYLTYTSRDPLMLVAPAAALRQKLPPPEYLKKALFYAVAGESLEREGLVENLLAGGYERRPVVEEKGEFSVRGGGHRFISASLCPAGAFGVLGG